MAKHMPILAIEQWGRVCARGRPPEGVEFWPHRGMAAMVAAHSIAAESAAALGLHLAPCLALEGEEEKLATELRAGKEQARDRLLLLPG